MGEKYQQFGTQNNIGWCGIARVISSIKNQYVKRQLKLMRSILPKKLFSCPLSGIFEVTNVDIKSPLLALMPKGDYHIAISFYEAKSPLCANISVEFLQTK